MATPRQRPFAGRLCLGVLLLTAALFQSGCMLSYHTPVQPPRGLIFSHIKAPLTTGFGDTPTGDQLDKISLSKTHYFRIWYAILSFSWGDIDLMGMAEKEKMKDMAYADYEYFDILGVYAEYRVHLYGTGQDSKE